jgi:hypothetical protein
MYFILNAGRPHSLNSSDCSVIESLRLSTYQLVTRSHRGYKELGRGVVNDGEEAEPKIPEDDPPK